MRLVSITALLAATALLSPRARACPECAEGVRRQVRAGIFDEAFARNLALTALPFGVLAGITAAIHHGRPGRRRGHG